MTLANVNAAQSNHSKRTTDSRNRHLRQRGLMLIGVVAAIGIIGSVGGLLTTSIFQFSRANSVTGAFDEVSTQTTRASRWLIRDIRNHATTDVPLSGTANSATFNILDSGSVISCNYSLSGTDLVRDCDGTVNVAGNNIENLEFSRSGTSIDVSFDVISDSRPDISEPVDLVIRSDVSSLVTGRMGLMDVLSETSIIPIDMIDFETDGDGAPLSAGEMIYDEFASLGIEVWVTNSGGGDTRPGHGYGDKNHEHSGPPGQGGGGGGSGSDPWPAMIFNSTVPTGQDKDLGTPNKDFGGAGNGNGGSSGEPGENAVDLGNVLIISEDGDSSDPDDDAKGGTIHFGFTTPVDICSVGMLDIEESFSGIKTYSSEGILINSHPVLDYGNNSVQTVAIGDTKVSELQITLPGSGAVSFIAFSCS